MKFDDDSATTSGHRCTAEIDGVEIVLRESAALFGGVEFELPKADGRDGGDFASAAGLGTEGGRPSPKLLLTLGAPGKEEETPSCGEGGVIVSFAFRAKKLNAGKVDCGVFAGETGGVVESWGVCGG